MNENLKVVIVLSVVAYLSGSMVIVIPENLGFLESVVFSMAFKEGLQDPRIGIGEFYGFVRSAQLIGVIAVCFWCYKGNVKYMRLTVGLILVLTLAKWGIEYLAYGSFFRGADYSIKYYVMVIFSFVVLALFGATVEDENESVNERT